MFGRRARDTLEHPPTDPYAAARELMIEEQLRRRGVVMHSVLEAIREIPRHLFVPHEYSDRAYADEALPSLQGQTISQPYIIGIMTQDLAPRPGHRVLEIGTGTGYQTAILAHLVTPGSSFAPSEGSSPALPPPGKIFTIDRVPSLSEFAQHRLEAMDFHNVRFFVGDGSAGWPPDDALWDGPRSGAGQPLFDRILITAGAPTVPRPLLDQLADNGIMIVPVGPKDAQTLMRISRKGDTFEEVEVLSCRFVPLLGTHAWQIDDQKPQPAK